MSEEDVTIDGRRLKELKVNELKAACKTKNLPWSGNKAALVKRLKAAIQLENLQKAARNSPNAPTLPNSEIAEGSGENDFIKQYMENQRKLLQSQQHRFSSASEADSEDDAASQRSRSMVSPLAGHRSRSMTSESNEDSSHRGRSPESEHAVEEDPKVTVQATVTSVQEDDEAKDTVEKEKEGNSLSPERISDSIQNEEVQKKEPASAEPLPPNQEEPDKMPSKRQADVNGTAKVEDECIAVGVLAPDSLSVEESLACSGVSQESAPKKNTSETLIEDVQKVADDVNAPEELPEEVNNSEATEEVKVEDRVEVKGENKESKDSTDASVMNAASSKPKKKKRKVDSKATTTTPETVTEETVMDVDAMVNQEEELDYDENETPSQDRSELAKQDDTQEEETENTDSNRRRLRLRHQKKEKKERKRSRSDSRKEEEKNKQAVEEDEQGGEIIMQEEEEVTTRKRRKSSTAQDLPEKVMKEKTPETAEKKGRKRIKRQSLDVKIQPAKEETESRQQREFIETEEKVRSMETKMEAMVEPEEKNADHVVVEEVKVEEKNEDQPRKPFRRISLNKNISQSETGDTSKPRKRRWGSRNASNNETVNISSDLIKDLIDVKPEEIRKAIDDQDDLMEEPGELVEEEEVDEVLDISTEDVTQPSAVTASSSSDADGTKRSLKEKRDGEEDGEIVEEEEVVVEEVLETESGGEDDPNKGQTQITQHDNRKVISTKTNKTDTKPYRTISRSETKSKIQPETDDGLPPEKKKASSNKHKRSSKSVTVTRKTSPKEPSPPPEPREVTPARNPSSPIIHVKNLVRPFTVNQLKALLSKIGKTIEDSFWIDKIKSHCIISYESEEDAIKARKSLHGRSWPSSNPKKLVVDFCDQWEADNLRGIAPSVPPPLLVEERKKERKSKSENDEQAIKDGRTGRRQPVEEEKERRDRDRKEKDGTTGRRKSPAHSPKRRREEAPRDQQQRRSPERRRREGESRRDREQRRRDRVAEEHTQPLREWDRDKLDQEAEPQRQPRERDRGRRQSSPQPDERRERRKPKEEKPKVEEQPAKLLDDLFRKTKATPCIYWLPLTDEQVELRLKERQERREARAKLRREMEEEEAKNRAKAGPVNRRAGRSPDRRRGNSRTRRDSTSDRKQDRGRDSGRPQDRGEGRAGQVSGAKKKNSPGRQKAPKDSSASSSSDSSSDDDDSASDSDSDSDSGKSSVSPTSKKKPN